MPVPLSIWPESVAFLAEPLWRQYIFFFVMIDLNSYHELVICIIAMMILGDVSGSVSMWNIP